MSSGRRSTRAKAKPVNYAKEQAFSDEDVFEDSPSEDPVPKRGRPRSSRKSTSNDDVMDHADLDGGVYRPKKPVYLEKGYDTNAEPIRDRFPFLPEYEPDGSPRIDLIVGRRSMDEKEGSNMNTGSGDEENRDTSDNENEGDSDTGGRGRRKKSTRSEEKEKPSPSKNATESAHVEYEYLVKYKQRSYLHLEWKTGADLESMNKSAKAIYRRYIKKVAQGLDEELEDPNFDPSYALPQKIVADAEQELTMELSDKELLKWEKEREKELAEEESEEDTDDDNEGAAKGDKSQEENIISDKPQVPTTDAEEKKGE
jgi:hypothetical protein